MDEDELIRFIEEHLHIQLYDYQKQLLRWFCKNKPNTAENS
jgi:CMP-2-keto-3-deoxyoctulosonic acid synthetase